MEKVDLRKRNGKKRRFRKKKSTEPKRLYRIWAGMKQRCYNPKSRDTSITAQEESVCGMGGEKILRCSKSGHLRMDTEMI